MAVNGMFSTEITATGQVPPHKLNTQLALWFQRPAEKPMGQSLPDGVL